MNIFGMLPNEVFKFIKNYTQNIVLAGSIDTRGSDITCVNIYHYNKANKFKYMDVK